MRNRVAFIFTLVVLLSVGLVGCPEDDDGGSDGDTGNGSDTGGGGTDTAGGSDSGGGGGGASCENFAACGGDPVGSYSIGESCLEFDPDSLGFECDGLTADANSVATGTGVILADGTYAFTSTTTWDVEITAPATCVPSAQCGLVGGTVDADGNCVMTDSGVDDDDDVGTWEVNGNVITFTPDTGDPSDAEFCKQGGSLILRFLPDEDGDPTTILALDP